MSKWEISKSFSFCYGHRVWSQELIDGYSENLSCKCKFLHGHEGLINVYLESKTLERGMVTDFKHLGWFKKWLDDVLDHKFIMDINDPLLPHEVPQIFDGHRELTKDLLFDWDEGYKTINLSRFEKLFEYEPSLREKYEGMIFVDFVPTSENLSKWIFNIIQNKMEKIDVKVSRVQFYETPKSQANYYID